MSVATTKKRSAPSSSDAKITKKSKASVIDEATEPSEEEEVTFKKPKSKKPKASIVEDEEEEEETKTSPKTKTKKAKAIKAVVDKEEEKKPKTKKTKVVAPVEEDPIEEEEEDEEDPIEETEVEDFATYNEGTVTIRNKDDLRQHFVGLAGDANQSVYHPVIMALMAQDLAQATFHMYEFFMMDDFVSNLGFEVIPYAGAFGEAYKVYLSCPLLCGKDKLEIYPPPGAISWFKGAPYGNFHPENENDSGTNDLSDCNMSMEMSLSCPRSEPDLEKPLRRFREFIEAVWKKGAQFMYDHPKLAQPIKKFLAAKKTLEGSKKLITDAQRKALFFEAPYRRSLYKPINPKYPDPHVIMIRNSINRKTFPTESEHIAKNKYIAPSPLLQQFHDFVRPPKKEGKVQSYNVTNWYKIIDFDGKPIKRTELKELRAFDESHPDYDAKRGFVPPEKRTSIENGELCIPSFTIEFTVMPTKPDYGIKFGMEGPGIRKWKKRPDNVHGPSDIIEPDAEDEAQYMPLPGASPANTQLAITHATAAQLMITQTSIEDDDLLKADMPQPSAPPSDEATTTSAMQIEVITTEEEEQTITKEETVTEEEEEQSLNED